MVLRRRIDVLNQETRPPLSRWGRIKKSNALASNDKGVFKSSQEMRKGIAQAVVHTGLMAGAGAAVGGHITGGWKGAATGAAVLGGPTAAFYGLGIGGMAVGHWKNKLGVMRRNYKMLKARGESTEETTSKPLRVILSG